jgi:hypothetical protein
MIYPLAYKKHPKRHGKSCAAPGGEVTAENSRRKKMGGGGVVASLQLWGKHGERYNVGPKKTIAELVYVGL